MTELQKLINVLSSFPPERQEELAAEYRAEAEFIRGIEDRLENLSPVELERVRSLVQHGIDSGEGREVDFEEIKRRGRERLLRDDP